MYQKEFGLRAITVSSVSMAEYFVNYLANSNLSKAPQFECKYKDIMIAVPVNVLEIDRIDALAKKIKVGVFVDSLETLEYLKKLKNQIHIWIEIDIEYHRTGLDFSKVKPI
jgi:D-serine deaminase-like pyridoxal phosphate-dependent protein